MALVFIPQLVVRATENRLGWVQLPDCPFRLKNQRFFDQLNLQSERLVVVRFDSHFIGQPSVSVTELTDAELKELGKLTQLNTLDLSRTPVTDDESR